LNHSKAASSFEFRFCLKWWFHEFKIMKATNRLFLFGFACLIFAALNPHAQALAQGPAFAVLAAAANSVGGEPTQPRQIAVGDRAPSFVLKDQNDQEFSLEAMVKKGPVAVVFIRSIEWCAYCQLQTVQLSENLPRIQDAGGQVVMVCYDAPEKVKRFAKRRKINVPILSDAGSKTIEAYAMRAVNGAGDQLGSAQHGTFVIDRSGIVHSKPYLTSFEGAAAIDALVSALKSANAAIPKSQKSQNP
jgi:peroxiredoxin